MLRSRSGQLIKPLFSIPRISLPVHRAPLCLLRPFSYSFISRTQTEIDPNNPPFDSAPLPGSAPQHTSLLLLHSPSRPLTWPSRMEMASSLLAVISRKLKAFGGLANFSWDLDRGDQNILWKEEDVYSATLYRRAMSPVEIQHLSRANMDDVLIPLLQGDRSSVSPASNRQEKILHFFVCTHGARDCRCGGVGTDVANTLRQELERLRDPDGTIDGWTAKVGEVGHVGGHKFAANVLVYPEGHWYGNLRPSDVPMFVRHHLDRPSTSQSIPPSPFLLKHWRGSMHLSGKEQEQQHAAISTTARDVDTDRASDMGSKTIPAPRAVDEVEINYTSYDGKAKSVVVAKLGESLMEVAKRAQLDGIEGVCDGKLECATCHLYLPQASSPVPISPASEEEEEDMLEYALFRNEGESRLGCQIKVTRELAEWNKKGGIIRLPRY